MPFDFGQIAHLFGEAKPVEAFSEPDKKSEPVQPVNPIRKDSPAEVTKTGTLPGTEKPKKGKKTVPVERPESMKSDDTDKDQLLAKLWDTMLAAKVYDPLIVQSVVSEKDYYDITVPIRDYDADFIEGCLIEAWDQVNSLCQTKIHDLPF
jgi:hypothetical protein